jgi:hypothetical protein
MLTQSAETHFGNRAAIAHALGDSRSVSAVYQWKDVVPLAAARRLEKITEGKLRVNNALYDEFGHARRLKQSA